MAHICLSPHPPSFSDCQALFSFLSSAVSWFFRLIPQCCLMVYSFISLPRSSVPAISPPSAVSLFFHYSEARTSFTHLFLTARINSSCLCHSLRVREPVVPAVLLRTPCTPPRSLSTSTCQTRPGRSRVCLQS